MGAEDYEQLHKKIEELKQQTQGSEPQKKRRLPIGAEPYLSPQISHIKGGEGNKTLHPDNDFVVQLKEFRPHGDGPQPDEFFDDEFNGVYDIVTRFVEDNFGGFDINPDEVEWQHPWKEIDVTPLFIGLVERVEDADPDDPNGWDSLLHDASKRTRMIVGMIARIFTDKVFDLLLFGCTPNQEDMLNSLEKDMAENSLLDGNSQSPAESYRIRSNVY